MGLSFLHLSLTLCSLSFFGSYWSPWVPSSEPEPVLEICALSIMDLLDAGPELAWCLAKVTAAPQTCLSYSALCCWWTLAGCDFSQGLLLLSLASLVMSPAICGILTPPSIELLALISCLCIKPNRLINLSPLSATFFQSISNPQRWSFWFLHGHFLKIIFY